MLVSSTFVAGAYTRPASSTPAARAGEAFSVEAEDQAEPRYFNAISSISYGRLGDAYLAMKAQETGSSAGAQPADQAILSASGIAAALGAYSEVLEDA